MDHDHAERRVHAGHPAGPGYETTDAPARPIVQFAVGLVAIVAVSFALITALMNKLGGKAAPDPAATPVTNLYQQLDQLHKDEDADLGGYRYDPKTGVARIPIDRAMDLVAERGVPKGKGPKTAVELNRRDADKDKNKEKK